MFCCKRKTIYIFQCTKKKKRKKENKSIFDIKWKESKETTGNIPDSAQLTGTLFVVHLSTQFIHRFHTFIGSLLRDKRLSVNHYRQRTEAMFCIFVFGLL